ncbi:hypothetical protein GmHk_15G044428 [Glycine max]|uniref:Uncharacterized protein n=1 Tax=Glycine soja TaxID=3848 RepID=A0A445GWA3_GLYSO|nr:hypothetical protein GmHk_15G044428 [Glycine max]RZB65550.1 hypothetical protein D0Y65_041571 [Glycine soja]RZB65551.1 hypothetical protein D0Y65_041571 [Glycine soja]
MELRRGRSFLRVWRAGRSHDDTGVVATESWWWRSGITSSNNESQVARPNTNNNKELAAGRPKRQGHTSSYLKDYMLAT